LSVDEAVYASESGTAHRNRAIAHLLLGSGALRVAPESALDLYLRQCSVLVDVRDLAMMAATLANGGVNPVSRERAATAETVTKALTVMTTCGMYDAAGQWLYDVGLPAKSGVGGGIIAVLPGRLGIGVFSPPLDEHGNSVRGVAVCRQLARDLDLQLLRSSVDEVPPVRAAYTIDQVRSKRLRSASQAQVLTERGHEALAIEIQGHLDFTAVERSIRRVEDASPPPKYVVLDLSRVAEVYQTARRFRDALAATLSERGGSLVLSGVAHLADRLPDTGLLVFEDLDHALEWCEDQILGGPSGPAAAIDFRDHEAFAGIDANAIDRLAALMERRTFSTGELVQRDGQPLEGLMLVTAGRLSMYAGSDEARHRRVASVEAGMLLGELSVAGGVAATNVVADTDGAYSLLPTIAVANLRDKDPELWAALTTNLLSTAAGRIDRLRALLAGVTD
jgi:glutaminase